MAHFRAICTDRRHAASSNGQDAALSRLRWELDPPRCYQLMNTQTIELDGFEIELASELYCDRGGDHRELVDRIRIDRKRLGATLMNRRCCACGV